jgi:hypothetical protein
LPFGNSNQEAAMRYHESPAGNFHAVLTGADGFEPIQPFHLPNAPGWREHTTVVERDGAAFAEPVRGHALHHWRRVAWAEIPKERRDVLRAGVRTMRERVQT